MTDWKAVYEAKLKEYEELKKNQIEFQKSSELVDKQLDSQLELATKQVERLEARLEELENKINAEKDRYEVLVVNFPECVLKYSVL
mmetsp:Transcript_18610/g.45664  ORF Transcript_18610/g.45664 Transcript_18610/m.45664 type:complete len:86 (-) Transcript_18610:415-672(-)